jgi:hypothetical protein
VKNLKTVFRNHTGSLLSGEKITSNEYATYFWHGIPKSLRTRIENRILARNPIRDLSTPFSSEDVDKAAEAILQRDRFDRFWADSDSEKERSSGEESSSDSDSESSDSESEDDRKHRHSRRKSKSRRKRRGHEDKKDKSEISRSRTVNGSRKEVEGLIRQMSLLAEDDPQYRLAYYRALKLDPDISMIVNGPLVLRNKPQNTSRPPANIFQQSASPTPRLNIPRQPPPVRNAQLPPPKGSDITCFGCSRVGHGMSTCPQINELINKGILTRDRAGRVIHSNGSAIRRVGDENFLQAYEREARPVTHFITIHNDSDTESDSDDEGYDSQSLRNQNFPEDRTVFAVRDIQEFNQDEIYAAERPQKQITTFRKQRLEGVFPPRLKDLQSNKENRPSINSETGRPIRGTKNNPDTVKRSEQRGDRLPIPKNVVPVDVEKPRFNGRNDDEIVEDRSKRKPAGGEKQSKEAPEELRSPEIQKRATRRSAVSEHVDTFKILDRLLDAKVELAVGEVIGVSRELSSMLADSIKIKSIKKDPAVGLTTQSDQFRAKTRAILIKIEMECNGQPVSAIIDTGSQLNIASEKFYKTAIRQPLDTTETTKMNDANGGTGTLTGMVENVRLEFGGVTTRANLYVGEHVPFDLLLGRPWQRGNYVTIDELEDGTYLIFKDPRTLQPKYSVLVTPDGVNPKWDHEPASWIAGETPVSYSIRLAKEAGFEERSDDRDRLKMVKEELIPSRKNLEKDDVKAKRNVTGAMHDPPGKLSYQLNLETAQNINSEGEGPEEPPSTTFLPIPYTMTTPSLSLTRSEEDTSLIEPKMEMRLMPAHLRHEEELPPLFSQFSNRTEAEAFLARVASPDRVPNEQVGRDMVLSTRDALVIGHTIDDHGFDRTDLFLLNMGLVTPRDQDLGNQGRASNLDVQYGSAYVQFFPSIRGDPPLGWEIPHLTPSPVKSVVSDTSPTKTNNANLKQEADLLRPPNVARPSPSLECVLYSESTQDQSPTSHHEVDSSRHARSVHFISPSSESYSTPPNPHLLAAPPSVYATPPMSPPPLMDAEDDSDSEEEDELADDWEEFRKEIREEMEEERRRMDEEGVFEELREELYLRSVSTNPFTGIFFNEDSNSNPVVDSSSDSEDPDQLLERARLDELLRRRVREAEALTVLRQGEARIEEALGRSDRSALWDVTNLPHHSQGSSGFSGALIFSGDDPAPPPLSIPSSEIQVFHVKVPPPLFVPPTRPPTPFPSVLRPSRLRIPLPVPQRDEEMIVDQATSLTTSPPPCESTLPPGEENPATTSGEPPSLASESQSPSNGVVGESKGVSTIPPMSIEDLLVPKPRKLPPPPIYLRADRYREIKDKLVQEREFEEDAESESDGEGISLRVCFEPHINAMVADRIFFPLIEIHRPGPKTDPSIPILERAYHPYADLDVHYNILRTRSLIHVDLRTMREVTTTQDVPTSQRAVFSVLAPRDTAQKLVFPGTLWPDNFGPLDFPSIEARTLGDRLRQLRLVRSKVKAFVDRITRMFNAWEVEELKSPDFVLYTTRGRQLVECHVNRDMFFRILHPTFNPLITRSEATFLRGACYALRRYRQEQLAIAVDRLLRTPHVDEFLCRELHGRGCLEEDDDRLDLAKKILEQYEEMALGAEFYQ